MSLFHHPLRWPDGWPRTKTPEQNTSFKAGAVQIRRDLIEEIRLLGATNVVISSDMPLKRDGEPYADADPRDPGVAVYFRFNDKDFVMARDHWDSPWHNLRSITLVIEAIRSIERHGGQTMLDRSFAGFAQLPAGPDWRAVLGPYSTLDGVRARYRELARANHPDIGGSATEMAELNAAYEAAQRELAS